MSAAPHLAIIAAVARNGVIGIDNRLPWKLPEDLRHFKATTLGHPVIMGRKTWESLGRPLPGRMNIVVSRNVDYVATGGCVVTSLEEAIAAAAPAVPSDGTVFLIGGGELYRQGLALAERMVLTEVDADFAGDACFPPFDRAVWRELARETGVSADGLGYAFVTYAR